MLRKGRSGQATGGEGGTRSSTQPTSRIPFPCRNTLLLDFLHTELGSRASSRGKLRSAHKVTVGVGAPCRNRAMGVGVADHPRRIHDGWFMGTTPGSHPHGLASCLSALVPLGVAAVRDIHHIDDSPGRALTRCSSTTPWEPPRGLRQPAAVTTL